MCMPFLQPLPSNSRNTQNRLFYRYNREEVVRSLGKEINLNPPLTLGQLPDTPEELLKLDQVRHILSVKPQQQILIFFLNV